MISGLGEEHDHNHPDVEERSDETRHHADDHQPHHASLDRRGEDAELADESGGQRDAREGEHEHGERRCDDRRLAADARPRCEVRCFATSVPDHGDDRERTDRREAVRDEVEHRAGDTGSRCGGDTDQDEAGLGHG